MSELVIVLGKSGGGKSTSMADLDPQTTVIYNTVRKRIPFPGAQGKYGRRLVQGVMDDPYAISEKILEVFDLAHNTPKIKAVVVDDYQYVMALSYAKGKKAMEGWETFDRIFHHAVDVFTRATALREDLTVFLLSHTDEKEDINGREVSMKTMGRAFKEKMTPEGFSSILLIAEPDFTDPNKPRYRFRTNGESPAKSPRGMFPLYIPNDLQYVLERKNEYDEQGTGILESPVTKAAFERANMALDDGSDFG